MTFLLILILCLGLAMAGLSIRRRRKNASRSGRYRSPVGLPLSGINIERRAGAKKRGGNFRLQPAHIFMGTVLLVMIVWLAGGYFFPSSEGRTVMSETRAEAAAPGPSPQVSAISGRIDASGGGSMSGAALAVTSGSQKKSASSPPLPPEKLSGSLYSAAQSVVPDSSRLSQVGLMAAQPKKQAAPAQPKKTAAAPKAAAPAKKPAAVPPPPIEKVPVQAPAPAAPAAEAAPVKVAGTGRASMVAAASASSSSLPQLATRRKNPADQTILSASRQFTVLVGSFREKDNAEKYQAELNAAGEQAFIVAADIEGQKWHRVMSGRFSSRPEAEAHGRDLKRRGLDTGRFLVRSID